MREALRSALLCCALAVGSALVAVVVVVLVVVTTVLASVSDAVVVVFIAVSGVAFGGVGCVLLRQLLSLYIYKPKSHKIVHAIK